jgi:putative membrane protein
MNKDALSASSTDPRPYLAVERTFLAWIRTGVSLMGFGFVVARFGLFLRELAFEESAANDSHATLSMPAGIGLIAIGIIVTIVAAVRYRRRIHALDRGEFRKTFDMGFAFLVAGLLALIGLSVAIYLAVMFNP